MISSKLMECPEKARVSLEFWSMPSLACGLLNKHGLGSPNDEILRACGSLSFKASSGKQTQTV